MHLVGFICDIIQGCWVNKHKTLNLYYGILWKFSCSSWYCVPLIRWNRTTQSCAVMCQKFEVLGRLFCYLSSTFLTSVYILTLSDVCRLGRYERCHKSVSCYTCIADNSLKIAAVSRLSTMAEFHCRTLLIASCR